LLSDRDLRRQFALAKQNPFPRVYDLGYIYDVLTVKKGTKTAIMIVLAAWACFFGWQFKTNYALLMNESGTGGDTDVINVKLPDYQKKAPETKADYPLAAWGAGLVVSLAILGLLVAHEASQFFGNRTLKVLYNENAEGMANSDYEKAEEEWAKGNFLDAIQLMRDYLRENPREQHVALRIAEVYEKDLQNFLAAALEYEEVLKQKLPQERWGWAAIHLCNLYTSKLNQADKAVALLRRIDAEYGETAAAEKARKRLSQLEAEGMISSPMETAEEPAAPSNLPPGFAPKKF
jgi:tetratricopeptide (TPR) repeat protein